jgi:hypothetical protein
VDDHSLFQALEPRCLLSFSVTNLDESGAGSLRAAVAAANANPGPDEITFGVLGAIKFASAIRISDDLTITGPGSDQMLLSGGVSSPIFQVEPGHTVRISDVMIANSVDAASAILNASDLTLRAVTFLNNVAHSAGAVLSTGPLSVFNCTFTGNTTDQSGAAAIAVFDADAHIEDSVFSDNSAAGHFAAGAIFIDGGTLTVVRSTFSGNFTTALGESGGAIVTRTSATISDSTFTGNGASLGGAISASGALTVTGSTFSDNAATMGAAIHIKGPGAVTAIVNSTISGNTAQVLGGGVFNSAGNTLAVDNSTITLNIGGVDGGGILNQGTATLRSTIVAGNTSSTHHDVGGSALLAAGSVANLIGDAASAGGLLDGVDGNIVGVDPLLGPLADNGGPTLTRAPLIGSPAIDAGTNPRELLFDQRASGFPREIVLTDIGAVEVGSVEGGGGGGGGGGLPGSGAVETFSISSEVITRGDTVTLTASVTPGHEAAVARVDFFLDANHDDVAEYNELIGSATINGDGTYSFAYTQTFTLTLGDARFIAVAIQRSGARTRSIGLDAAVVNAPPVIGALTPSTRQFVQGELGFTLIATDARDVDGRVRLVRFYADLDGNGVAEPAEELGEDADGTDGFSYALDQEQSRQIPLGDVAFLAVAYDISGGVSTPAPGTASVLFATTAGTGRDVVGTADAADRTSVTTVTATGHVLVFEQGWAVADLQAITGAPGVVGDAVIWHDPADGQVYVAAPTAEGLLLFARTAGGHWTVRNLNAETGAPDAPTHALTSFTSVGGVVVIAGITGSGRIVAFEETFARPGVPPTFSFRDLSADLESQGMHTPRVDALISYVTTWDSWHLAGIDDAGRIQSVWINRHVDGFTKWRVDDLSASTGAPSIGGQLAVTLTSWGGINLTGLDADGNLLTTWWVPAFAGEWRVNNLTEQFGGAKFSGASVSGYTTPWGGLNYVGLDDAGRVTVYWWAPGAADWNVSPLLPDSTPSEQLPTGKLTSAASQSGTLNVFGSAAGGDVIRMSWQPDAADTPWTAENLTDVAQRM